ncbi:hypothetical protein C8J57DRAFT_1352791, partial [Mycena rebaudengoi]
TNWRKYADLNMRPVREESLPATTKLPKTVEKREGTPLAGPVSRRAKAGKLSCAFIYVLIRLRVQTSAPAHSTPLPQASVATQIRRMDCLKNGPLGKVL